MFGLFCFLFGFFVTLINFDICVIFISLVIALIFSDIVYYIIACIDKCTTVISVFSAFQTYLLRYNVLAFVFGLALGLISAQLIGWSRIQNWWNQQLWQTQVAALTVGMLIAFGFFNPDIWNRVTSIKAGTAGFEANLGNSASSSAATRDAIHLSLRDLNKDLAIKEWRNFATGYGDCGPPSSPKPSGSNDEINRAHYRQIVIKAFSSPEYSGDGLDIACFLFRMFYEPIAKIIYCANRHGVVEYARQSSTIRRAAAKWRDFILSHEQGVDKNLYFLDTINNIEDYNIDSNEKSLKLIREHIGTLNSDELCYNKYLSNNNTNIINISNIISDHKIIINTNAKFIIDPYVPGIIGDLLSFINGSVTGPLIEATFLDAVKARYVTDLNMTHPGIVNLYFTLARAKLRSNTYWSLESITGDLDVSYEMNERILNLSSNKAKEDNKTNFIKISRDYRKNKLYILSYYLEFYNQHTLAGSRLPVEHTIKWKEIFMNLEGILNSAQPEITISLADLPALPISEEESNEWRQTPLKGDDKFDLKVALALSSVLLTEKNGQSPPEACAAANHYLLSAKSDIPAAAKAVTDVIKLLDDTPVTQARLSGFLDQIKERVGSSCP